MIHIGCRCSHVSLPAGLQIDDITFLAPDEAVDTNKIAVEDDESRIQPPFGILLPILWKIDSGLQTCCTEQSEFPFSGMSIVISKPKGSELLEMPPLTARSQ